MSWRAEFFSFNAVGRAIARPFDLLAPWSTWVYGGEYVNPLSGEMLSARRRQDADVLSMATGPAGIVRGTAARGVVGGFRMTESVANHLADVVGKGPFKGELARPFLNSPLTIREIMAAGKGVPDPGGVAGALRWDVPGFFRGAEGTWELVIKDDLILHFNFVGN